MLLEPAFFQIESSVDGGDDDWFMGGAEGAEGVRAGMDPSLEVALIDACGVTVTVVVAIK